MKKSLFITILLVAATAVAALRGAPFIPESDARFSAVEARATVLEALPSNVAATTNGTLNLRVARFTIDCTTSGDCSVGAHSTGVALPAKAFITNSFFYTKTRPVSVSGTMAVHCEDANNLLSAIDLEDKQSGEKFLGAAIGTSNTTIVTNIAAACNITHTEATQPYSAGVINGWVEYEVHD